MIRRTESGNKKDKNGADKNNEATKRKTIRKRKKKKKKNEDKITSQLRGGDMPKNYGRKKEKKLYKQKEKKTIQKNEKNKLNTGRSKNKRLRQKLLKVEEEKKYYLDIFNALRITFLY